MSLAARRCTNTPVSESAANLALMRRIDELYLQYAFYGARQMVRHLARERVQVGRHRVRLLDEFRVRNAMGLPSGPDTPAWSAICPWPQRSYGTGSGWKGHAREWGNPQSALVKHYLARLLGAGRLDDDERRVASTSTKLMKEVWSALRDHDRQSLDTSDHVLLPAQTDGTFHLNPRWLRVRLTAPGEVWECATCATVCACNVRGVCPRNRCPGVLQPVDHDRLAGNHYRSLYESRDLPPALHAVETGSDSDPPLGVF